MEHDISMLKYLGEVMAKSLEVSDKFPNDLKKQKQFVEYGAMVANETYRDALVKMAKRDMIACLEYLYSLDFSNYHLSYFPRRKRKIKTLKNYNIK